MGTITYTFPVDCPAPALRGVTVTGGEFCRIDGKWQAEPDAVRFAERVAGKAVVARIAGKPELEAALAAHNAAKLAVANRLEAIGWPQYQAVQRRAVNARYAYDVASDRGYPAKEAADMRKADAELDAARVQYPLAAAYAKAEAYSMASNDQKSSVGRNAMEAIESGADLIAAVKKMEIDWSAAASKSVENS